MQIDGIDVYLTRFPLAKPYVMAGHPLAYFDTVLVRMQSDGVSGWGEVFPGNEPTLTAAWSSAVFACLKECLLPRLAGTKSIDSSERLAELLDDIKGNRHAKAALDLAWWDLFSKLKKQPLHQAIGGQANKEIEVGLAFDRSESPDAFLEEIGRAVSDGFKRITLKIRPGWDLQVVGVVRSEYPTQMIQCDVEGTLRLEMHGETIYRFDDYMISLLEQPLSASEYVGHAMLQDSLRTTIGLDESITTRNQAEIALDLRSAGTFCLKPGKVGGLTEAKAIQQIAMSGEIDCYIGADILTSIGYRFVAALASLPGVGLPTDYVRFDEHLIDDPGVRLKPVLKPAKLDSIKTNSADRHPPTKGNKPSIEVHPDENGNMVVDEGVPYDGPNVLDGENRLVLELWTEPGIGFEPDFELIERNAIESHGVKR